MDQGMRRVRAREQCSRGGGEQHAENAAVAKRRRDPAGLTPRIQRSIRSHTGRQRQQPRQ